MCILIYTYIHVATYANIHIPSPMIEMYLYALILLVQNWFEKHCC